MRIHTHDIQYVCATRCVYVHIHVYIYIYIFRNKASPTRSCEGSRVWTRGLWNVRPLGGKHTQLFMCTALRAGKSIHRSAGWVLGMRFINNLSKQVLFEVIGHSPFPERSPSALWVLPGAAGSGGTEGTATALPFTASAERVTSQRSTPRVPHRTSQSPATPRVKDVRDTMSIVHLLMSPNVTKVITGLTFMGRSWTLFG